MVKSKPLESFPAGDEDLECYCITKAKECIVKGDHHLAKSWFLTASNLFPDSSMIKFERYLMARNEGDLTDASEHFNEIFIRKKLDDPIIVDEMKKIVNAMMDPQDSPESNFYRNLFHSFSSEAQYQFLIAVMNIASSIPQSCQLMLLIMKRFPEKVNEHLPLLLSLINRAESERLEPKDIEMDGKNLANSIQDAGSNFFDKLLVFGIFPVILSNDSNLSVPQDILLSLLDRAINFFIRSSSILQVSNGEDKDNQIKLHNCEATAQFDEVFDMFGRKLDWDLLISEEPRSVGNFLSGVLLSTLQRIQTYYSTLSVVNTSEQSDGPIDLSSAKVKTECTDINGLRHTFYAALLLFLKCFTRYIQETAGKLVLVEHGTSYKGDPMKKRKIFLKNTSPLIVTDNSELQENLIVSAQCHEFFMADSDLQKEFLTKMDDFGLINSRAYQIFKQDLLIYKGSYEESLTTLTESATTQVQSYLQLMSSSLMSYNYPLALKYSVEAVSKLHRMSDDKDNEAQSKDLPFNANANGRQLFFIKFYASNILSYCIEVIISCLKDKFLLSVKPPDQGVGHLIVLTQYNWPKEADLFLKCIATIRKPTSGSPATLAKFFYPPFCDYIFNPDMLEEFMALVNSDGIIIELKEQAPLATPLSKITKSSKSMTTRRVGKNAKEEIKTTLVNQMRQSKLILNDALFVSFILSQLRELPWIG